MSLLSDAQMLYSKQVLKIYLKFILYLVLLWLAFVFLFRFGYRQGLGLSLAILVAMDLTGSKMSPKLGRFYPYKVTFEPNLYAILTDLGLIASPEEYKVVRGDRQPIIPWLETNIFHYSIRAVVLSHDAVTETEVIHFPEVGVYDTHLRLAVRLSTIKFPTRFFDWSPEWFFRIGIGGYHIGIEVNHEWWDANKSKVAPETVITEDRRYNFGTVRLTLAIFPFETLHEFYLDLGRGYQEKVKDTAANKGWENQTLGGDEIGYFGEEYKHKYITIRVQNLDLSSY